jgi:photosystem II stability/assembly factor-like uncharacterized protein
MTKIPELESLYLEAKKLIKARDYSTASTLLKQILEENDGYKDVSRLLASIVKKKRYRWYKDWLIWGGVVTVGIAGLLLIVISRLPQNKARLVPFPTSTNVNEIVFQPTITSTIIPTPTRDLNTGRFEWKRINSGKQFERENITSLAIYPGDPSIIYAATENAGIYKTIDGGKSWAPILNGLMEATFKIILVSGNNPQSVLALSAGGWVYQSFDAGENWKKLWSNSFLYNSFLIQDPTNGQHLISKQNDILVESKDFGITWTTIASPTCPNDFVDIEIDAINNFEMTAIQVDNDSITCPGGVYKTFDGGKTWTGIGLELSNLTNLEISGDYIYAVTGASAEVFVSPDRGETWQGPFLPANDRCVALGVDPNNEKKAFCLLETQGGEKTNIWETSDAGTTWSELARLDIHGSAIDIPFFTPETIFVSGRGLEISSDLGENWDIKQNGLASRTFELLFDPSDSTLLYAYESHCLFNYSKLYISFDAGYSYELITDPGSSDDCGLSIGFGGMLYRWQFWEYLSSDDQGKTWVKWENTIQTNFITAIGANPNVKGLLLATIWNSDTIFRTSDDGKVWSPVDSPVGSPENYYFTGENSKRVYATNFGTISRSDDAGESWRSCSSLTEKLGESASNLAIDPKNMDTIYIATRGGGVMKSMDGCYSFNKINNGLTNLFVNSIAVDPNDPQHLFVGTIGGVYISFNGGESWFQVTDGLLGATIVYSVVVNPSDSTVLASTPYGIFKLMKK